MYKSLRGKRLKPPVYTVLSSVLPQSMLKVTWPPRCLPHPPNILEVPHEAPRPGSGCEILGYFAEIWVVADIPTFETSSEDSNGIIFLHVVFG